jgi:hypothetical protein
MYQLPTTLADDVKSAALAAVRDLLAARSDETFYAFALYTSDDASSISLAANSEEGLARVKAKYAQSGRVEESYLRWSTSEWAYEDAGVDHFFAINQVLREAAYGDVHGRKFEPFETFQTWVLEIMVQTLRSLDSEGVFGRGKDRYQITLMCAMTDADASGEDYNEQSVRQLNPPLVVEAFLSVRHTPPPVVGPKNAVRFSATPEYAATQKARNAARRDEGPPCPKCGLPLRTAKAKQCFKCGAKWHDVA